MCRILCLSLVLVSCLAASAGAQTLVGAMLGTVEAPGPGDPDGFGLAGFRFEGTSVTYTMIVKNIAAPTASHIHRGAAGVPGPVVITLASAFPNNVATGIATASASLIEEIRDNPSGFYLNVHNSDFPGGAIRAQLTDGAFAFATGAQEAPGPGDPDGSGMAIFTGGESGSLNYAAMVQDIDAPSASHIHRGAAGVPGPVVITLASSYPNDIFATGTVTVADTLFEEIIGNPTGFYFNVHNAAFGDGAVRGQLSLAPYSQAHYFPVVGRVDGLNNTHFVADVRVVNRSSETENVMLEFFPSSPTGLSAASAVRGVAVAPGAELVIDDVVASQFSTTGSGALKIGTASEQIPGVRFFNDLRPVDGGTTGFFIRSKGISEAATSGVLPFLSQASDAEIQTGNGFRSNIGWFNPNLADAGATFRVHRASDGAVLGSVDVGIAALSQLQQAVFTLVSAVAPADRAQADFYVTWTSTRPIYVYGAVVDNKTADVVYVD